MIFRGIQQPRLLWGFAEKLHFINILLRNARLNISLTFSLPQTVSYSSLLYFFTRTMDFFFTRSGFFILILVARTWNVPVIHSLFYTTPLAMINAVYLSGLQLVLLQTRTRYGVLKGRDTDAGASVSTKDV